MAIKKARIALYMTYLEMGGAERVMLNLAEGFAAQGYQVDLLVTQGRGAFRQQIPEGVNLIDFNATRTMAVVPVLMHYLWRHRPAVLLSALSHNNVIALLAGLLTNTRVVVSEHGMISLRILRSPNWRERFIPILSHFLYPLAGHIVVVSQAGADDLAQTAHLPRKLMHVIHNPVIRPEMWQQLHMPLEHPWFGPTQPPVILSAGRLVPAKGFEVLLKAFAILRKSRPAHLIILGEGPHRLALEACVRMQGLEADVLLPGYEANPYRYMARSNVFALTSYSEGFGNVLVEAMACGTSVVATQCPGGPVEILDHGEYGRLIPVGDIEELAQALSETLDHPWPPDKLRARAQEFSIDKIASQYLEILLPREKA